MRIHSTPATRAFAGVLATLGWAALIFQFPISVRTSLGKGLSVALGASNYFSYFTIIMNTVVALALAWPLLQPASRAAEFFTRPRVTTGIAMCITIVGAVYSLMLRALYHPQGWSLVFDHIFHDIVPPAFVLYWWLTLPANALRLSDVPKWLITPALYLVYTLGRGALIGWYPYPFINVTELGYGAALTNAAGMTVGFGVVGFAMLGASKLKRGAVASTAEVGAAR